MSKVRQPCKACDADLSLIRYPVMGFAKIDGVRIVNLDGDATARTLEPHGNIFTTKKFSNPIYLGIDGEGTRGDITGNSLCRDTTSALNTHEGEPDVKWNAFDFLREDIIDLDYLERYDALVDYIAKNNIPDVTVIPYIWLHNEEEVLAFYNKCLDEGYEGIVLRDPKGKHKDGRATAREATYTRMKPQSDKEAIVMKLVEAKTNLNEKKKNALGHSERSSHKENLVGKGMLGMMVCKDLTSGLFIDVGPGKMTHEERIYYWNNPDKLLKQYIKYRSMDKGIKTLPRFPRFICLRSKVDIVID